MGSAAQATTSIKIKSFKSALDRVVLKRSLDGKHLCLTKYPYRDVPALAMGDAFNGLSRIRAATCRTLLKSSLARLEAAPDPNATSSYDIVVAMIHNLAYDRADLQ